MNNTMRMVFSHIHHSVPDTILKLAFSSDNDNSLIDKTSHAPVTVDQIIHKKIIKGRVLDDCNLVGGKQKQIILRSYMLEKAAYTQQEKTMPIGPCSFYRIPPEDRDNQPITRISHVDYPSQYMSSQYDSFRPTYGVSVRRLARSVLASHTGGDFLPPPKAEPVDGGLIRLFPAQYSHIDWVITADIAYDEYFTSLNPEAVSSFREMVLSATKAYIYNKLIIEIDQGKILYGADIGVIRDIITEYKEEESKYNEMLGEFSGGVILDLKKQNELIFAMV